MRPDEALTIAKAVHAELRGRARWTSDQELHGVAELWRLPRTVGTGNALIEDCDGLNGLWGALQLAQRGVPAEWIYLATCWVAGAYHCVSVLNAPGVGQVVIDETQASAWTMGQLERSADYVWDRWRCQAWPDYEWRQIVAAI